MKTKLLTLVLCMAAFCTSNAMAKEHVYYLDNEIAENVTVTLKICTFTIMGPERCREEVKQVPAAKGIELKEPFVEGYITRVQALKAATTGRAWGGGNACTILFNAPRPGVGVLNFKVDTATDKVACYISHF